MVESTWADHGSKYLSNVLKGAVCRNALFVELWRSNRVVATRSIDMGHSKEIKHNYCTIIFSMNTHEETHSSEYCIPFFAKSFILHTIDRSRARALYPIFLTLILKKYLRTHKTAETTVTCNLKVRCSKHARSVCGTVTLLQRCTKNEEENVCVKMKSAGCINNKYTEAAEELKI